MTIIDIVAGNDEEMATQLTVLLFNALASQRFGSQRRTMQTRADAEMISDASEESGSVCMTSAAIAEPSAARERIAMSVPIE